MSNDIEPATSRDLAVVAVDTDPAVAQAMRTAIVKAVVVAVPLAVLVFVGLVALALRGQDPNWAAYLTMAVGIGVLAGAFFGMLAGFIRSAHLFDD